MKQVDAHFELCKFVVAAGTQAEAAKQLGITEAYLSDVLKRKRGVGPKIINALNLKQIFVRINKTKTAAGAARSGK